MIWARCSPTHLEQSSEIRAAHLQWKMVEFGWFQISSWEGSILSRAHLSGDLFRQPRKDSRTKRVNERCTVVRLKIRGALKGKLCSIMTSNFNELILGSSNFWDSILSLASSTYSKSRITIKERPVVLGDYLTAKPLGSLVSMESSFWSLFCWI